MFIGDVYKCLDLEKYKKYGTSRFVPYFKVGSMIEGSMEEYAKIYFAEEYLVLCNNKYVLLNEESKLNLVLLGLGIDRCKHYPTVPRYNGEYFVEPKTLRQFKGEDVNFVTDSVSLLKLKRRVK